MSLNTAVPRKQILTALAGAAALSAAPLSLAAQQSSRTAVHVAGADEFVRVSRAQVAAAFRSVRTARLRDVRARAFQALKTAIITNEHSERMALHLATSNNAGIGGLFIAPNAAHALSRSIVRELEHAPKYDRRWLHRLGELESLLRDEVMA